MPAIKCLKCGRETLYEGETPRFCSHCAGALPLPAQSAGDAQKQEYLHRARAQEDTAQRHAILLEARERFPEDFEIEKEILFLGRLYERGGKPDFYRIPFWPLAALENPKEYPAKERKQMLERFFQNPEIARVAALSANPDAFWDEYLLYMSRGYVNMFLKGASANSTLLGFRRRPGEILRRCAQCMARMLAHARACELVPESLRNRLSRALFVGFCLEFPDTPAREYLLQLTEKTE